MVPCYAVWQRLRNIAPLVSGKPPWLKDPDGVLHLAERNAMGHLERLRSLKDLPAERILIAYLKKAALLNKNKVKTAKPKAAPKKELPIPKALEARLKKNKKTWAVFEAFSPSNRREYIEWINSAKTEADPEQTDRDTVEWVGEGKSLNWKYKK